LLLRHSAGRATENQEAHAGAPRREHTLLVGRAKIFYGKEGTQKSELKILRSLESRDTQAAVFHPATGRALLQRQKRGDANMRRRRATSKQHN
jgi:hypothetical protein